MQCHQSSNAVDDRVGGPIVDLSHRGLVSIPFLDFRSTLVSLYLQDNKLTGELPHLGELPNLRNLDLSDNLLSAVPEYCLERCVSLARVSLANNPRLVSIRGLHEVRRTLRALDVSGCPSLANMWPVGFSLNLSVLLCDKGDLSEDQGFVCHKQPRGIGAVEKRLYWEEAGRRLEQYRLEQQEGYHFDTYDDPDVTPRGKGNGLCVRTPEWHSQRCSEQCRGAEYVVMMDTPAVDENVDDGRISADSWEDRGEVTPSRTSEQLGRRGFENERARTVSDAQYMQGLPRSRNRDVPSHCCKERRGPRPPLRGGSGSRKGLAAAMSCERSRRCLIFAARVAEVCLAAHYRDKAFALGMLAEGSSRFRRELTSSQRRGHGTAEYLGPLDGSGHAYDPKYQNSVESDSSSASSRAEGAMVHHRVRQVDVVQLVGSGIYDGEKSMSTLGGRPPLKRHASSVMDRTSSRMSTLSSGDDFKRRATVGGLGDRKSVEVLQRRPGSMVTSSSERFRDDGSEMVRQGASMAGRGSVEVLPSRARRSIDSVSGSRGENRGAEVLADEGSSGTRGYRHYHERMEIMSGAKQLIRDESVDITRLEEAALPEESILVEAEPLPPLVGSRSDSQQIQEGDNKPLGSLVSGRREEQPSLLSMPYRSALSNEEEDALLKLHGTEARR